MTLDREAFKRLCADESVSRSAEGGIGVYCEKRLHRILKRVVYEDTSAHEVKVGKSVADVFDGRVITEIQTGSFYPIRDKIEYYLRETEYKVILIHPVIADKRIIRADKESGEVIRIRRSPKRIGVGEIMREVAYLGELVKNDRLEIVVLYISADEYRYSEAMRYRREGRYDSELFPREIISEESFCGTRSYAFLLDGMPERFSAKEYGQHSGMKGRELYATLKLLCALGLLERERQGKAYEDRRAEK